MALADETERIVEEMRIKTRVVVDQRILKDAFAEFQKASPVDSEEIKSKVFSMRFIRIAAVAAIVIIFLSISLTRFNKRLAAPKQIYNALLKSGDFTISCFNTDSQQPYMQVWVSKSLEMQMFKTIEADSVLLTLWDIPMNQKTTSNISTSKQLTETITEDMLTELDDSLIQIISFGRFTNINQIPENAEWHRVYDRNIINQHPDSDVYELTWPQENAAGKMENIKWRMFLAVNSNKIKRSDVYKKSSPDEQYKLEGLAVISYLQKEEIKTIIQNNFDLIRSEPVHRPTGI